MNQEKIYSRLIEIETKLAEYDKRFSKIYSELYEYKNKKIKTQIFYSGQIFDSYSLIIDIIKSAKHKILLIDNYADSSVLKMLAKKNKNVEVCLVTLPNTHISNLDILKFNSQYPIIKIVRTNKFHDRFILIDNSLLYHCGASLKDFGKKCFAINKISDNTFIEFISNIV